MTRVDPRLVWPPVRAARSVPAGLLIRIEHISEFVLESQVWDAVQRERGRGPAACLVRDRPKAGLYVTSNSLERTGAFKLTGQKSGWPDSIKQHNGQGLAQQDLHVPLLHLFVVASVVDQGP